LINVDIDLSAVNAEEAKLSVEALEEHTAEHDDFAVVIVNVKELNKDSAETALFLVVSSEGSQGNSQVLNGIVGIIEHKLEVVVPKALVIIVSAGVGKDTVSALFVKAGCLTIGNDG